MYVKIHTVAIRAYIYTIQSTLLHNGNKSNACNDCKQICKKNLADKFVLLMPTNFELVYLKYIRIFRRLKITIAFSVIFRIKKIMMKKNLI